MPSSDFPYWSHKGWQPAKTLPGITTATDLTSCQTKYLDDGVTLENRRTVGSVDSGSYAAGRFDPANPNWWNTSTPDPNDIAPAKVRLAPSEEELLATRSYLSLAGIGDQWHVRNMDIFFVWAISTAQIKPQSHLGQCVCQALVNLKEDSCASFLHTRHDHTTETTTGNQTTAGSKSKWSTTIWQHNMRVEIAIASEKATEIYFVTPSSQWGRSAAFLPDGSLEEPPTDTYLNGCKTIVYPTSREGQVLAIVFPTGRTPQENSIWFAVIKDTHDKNNLCNALQLISNTPPPCLKTTRTCKKHVQL
eukprot:16428033-Heterocapsa_arctica.AAC.1